MRVLMIGVSQSDQQAYKEKILSNINPQYAPCIIIDAYEQEQEEFEYCAECRRYDFVVVHFNSNYWKSYIEVLKIINDNYEIAPKICFIVSDYAEDWQFAGLQKHCEKFTKLDLTYNTDIMGEIDECKYIGKALEKYFVNHMRFYRFDLDAVNKKVAIKIRDASIELKVENEINFKVLSYFLRHHGETLSLNQIISAISENPEYEEEGAVKNIITNLRSVLRLFTNSNSSPLYFVKESAGYKFQLQA